MSSTSHEYDAVIVGASLAGCTAATLLGRAGARVALLEQRPDAHAFKRICSHFIQASAVPTLERLGLLEEIEQHGGVRSRLRVWTRWGWASMASPDLPGGVNLRRERLDPLIRAMAAETPGVDLRLGAAVEGLLHAGGAVSGVEVLERAGARTQIRARVVIGADGRDSRVAELAHVRKRSKPHGRIAYGGYFEGPGPFGAPNGSMWILDPQWAAAFPTDSGLTFYAAMMTKDHLPEFKRDPEAALRSVISALPDAPPIDEARLVSPILGKVDMTNVMRGPIAPGLALAGDAALAADPLWGVGCGWALQSAEWLADSLAPALRGDQSLARALRRYRRRFRRGLAAHAFFINDYASGRRLQAPERLLWSAAVRDARTAELMESFGTRSMSPARFMTRALPRAAAVRLGLAGRATARPEQPVLAP